MRRMATMRLSSRDAKAERPQSRTTRVIAKCSIGRLASLCTLNSRRCWQRDGMAPGWLESGGRFHCWERFENQIAFLPAAELASRQTNFWCAVSDLSRLSSLVIRSEEHTSELQSLR